MMKMRKRFAIGLLSCLTCLATSNSLSAQNRYEQLPVVAMPKNIAEVKKEAGPLAQASKDVIKAAIESWMGRMTEGKESPERARGYLEADLRSIVSEDGIAVANKTALDLATKVINGNYMPAAKINSMLTLVELSEGPVNTRFNTPFTGAVGELLKYASNKDLQCYLRSIALVGLDRHVKLGKSLNDGTKTAADRRNSVAAAMVEIIRSQPTLAQEEDAHWWMVRRAYDVILSLHAAGERAKETPMSPGLRNAAVVAMDQFNDPKQLTSIRYSAGTFLTRFDFSAMKPAFRMKLFLGVANFLDQEVVGWYEHESDKTKMLSGAGSMMGGMGGMPGMDMGGGMGSGEGAGGMPGMDMGGAMGGAMGGYGSGEGAGGMPGMGGGGKGSNATGPKPVDTQQWDLRLARRKLNMYTQLAHALLKGTLSKEERDYHPSGKGIMEAELPKTHQRAGKFLIEALEDVQEKINERTLVTVGSLMGRLLKPLTDLRDAVELIPAYTEPDPNDKTKEVEIVKSFKDFSPRMQSTKKADASGKLESTAAPAPAAPAPPAADGAAPAGAPAAPGAAAPAAPGGAAPGAAAPGGAAPAAGPPVGGN